MKVGLFINTQFPEGFNLADRIPEMVAQVCSARDSGFASLLVPASLAGPSDADAACWRPLPDSNRCCRRERAVS